MTGRQCAAHMIRSGTDAGEHCGGRVGLTVGILPLTERCAVFTQDARMGDANGQRPKGSTARIGAAVVVLAPANQVTGRGEPAAMFGAGANRRETNVGWRRRPLVYLPAPTHGGRAAKAAGVIPAGVDCREVARRRISLLVVVSTPAVDAPVCLKPTGEPPPRRNLLKLHVGRNILLSLIIWPPTHGFPVLSQGTPVILARGYLHESRTVGSRRRF